MNIAWEDLPRHIKATEITVSKKLKEDITSQEKLRLLMHHEWPRRPFIYLAERLELTTTKKVSNFITQKYTKATSNEETEGLQHVITNPKLKNDIFNRMLQKNFEKAIGLLHKVRETHEEKPVEASVVSKIQRFLDTYEQLPKTLRKKLQNEVHAKFPAEFFKMAQSIGCFKKTVAIAKRFRSDTSVKLSDETQIDGVRWRVWKHEAMKDGFLEQSRFKYMNEDHKKVLK